MGMHDAEHACMRHAWHAQGDRITHVSTHGDKWNKTRFSTLHIVRAEHAWACMMQSMQAWGMHVMLSYWSNRLAIAQFTEQ